MAGIYIHIPFCKSRCKYCDFFSTTHLSRRDEYVSALLREWQMRQQAFFALLQERQETVNTIYIGGGTPSTLDISSLQLILDQVLHSLKRVNLEEVREITLEVNPGDVTAEKAAAWRSMGINRLSMGVQSFSDTLLQLMGRRHSAQQAREVVATAKAAGFDNLSIDLMYALPSQTIEQWQQDVAQALLLGVQHISSYGLIYEEGTILTTLLENGVIQAVDEDLEMQMYDYLVNQLTAHGYEHYEVSNFALPGRQSQHNSSYWCDTPYLGLGAGAHSYDGLSRWWNPSNLDTYIADAQTHTLQAEQEELTAEARHMERIMLGLRTNQGIAIELVDSAKAEYYIQQGLLYLEGDRLIATTQGFHILNRIIEDLV
jgi:oxygen-independent coproporphyrinogen-3 oxidase